jgi:nicotinate phosphoribosyltransferase
MTLESSFKTPAMKPGMQAGVDRSALFTDLYELTMLQAYFAEGMTASAVFELFFRQLPASRSYVMAAGLEDVLNYTVNLRFTEDELDWLRGLGRFSDSFIEQLRDLRFTGDVFAVPEGTLVFGNEPVLQVVAPLPQAQLLETFALNQIHLQSVCATKAARLVTAAGERTVVDFGSRRAHGIDAALKVARNSYLAGAAGTSNVLASRLYGIPAFGTMAHSYVQAHADERVAFRSFARQFPGTTLLVDTYDTVAGIHNAIDLAAQLGEEIRIGAVRLDSGDMLDLSRRARQLLDSAGLEHVKIFATSGLNERKIAALLEDNAPIDSFGVGTELAVSKDAPDIDFSYKLMEYAGRPRMKLSEGKTNPPGRKQVFRSYRAGKMIGDVIACAGESLPGEPLLQPVIKSGRRITQVSLAAAREHVRAQLAALPAHLKRVEVTGEAYKIELSTALTSIMAQLQEALRQA